MANVFLYNNAVEEAQADLEVTIHRGRGQGEASSRRPPEAARRGDERGLRCRVRGANSSR
eukprot:705942-Pyramimonas_sp.AAC.1